VIHRRAAALAVLGWLVAAGAAAAGEAVPRMLAEGEVLRGHFVQDRVLAGFAKPLHSEGSFVLVGGKGLIWQGETPFKTTTVISASGILQLVDGKEAMRLPASRLPVLSHFYEVLSGALSGDSSLLEKDFKVAATADAARWRLVLTPARQDDVALGQIASITVSGPDLADEVEIRKQAGDADHLRFLDQSVAPTALTAEESRLLTALGE
jgi:hypothetical protein